MAVSWGKPTLRISKYANEFHSKISCMINEVIKEDEWLLGLSGGSRVYIRVSRNAAGYIPC